MCIKILVNSYKIYFYVIKKMKWIKPSSLNFKFKLNLNLGTQNFKGSQFFLIARFGIKLISILLGCYWVGFFKIGTRFYDSSGMGCILITWLFRLHGFIKRPQYWQHVLIRSMFCLSVCTHFIWFFIDIGASFFPHSLQDTIFSSLSSLPRQKESLCDLRFL